MDKTQNRKDIFGTIKADPPVGNYLQQVFWSMVKQYDIQPNVWNGLMKSYVENPLYHKNSRSTKLDRAKRITTALTGTTGEAVVRDFMWKRFIEGLVITKVKNLMLTCEFERGRYGTKKIVFANTNPSSDHIRTLKKEDYDHDTSSNVFTLEEYFSDTEKTAYRTMQHILLKIMWGFMHEYRIDYSLWSTMLNRYVHNKENCPQMNTSRTDRKHNIQQSMRQTKSITWKRFLEVLKVSDVRNLRCSFHFENESGIAKDVLIEIDLTTISFKNGDKNAATKSNRTGSDNFD